jgi:glutathione gamma-glutamylcysteinyltransferase
MEVCGHSLDKVRAIGLSFREFESLAGCHGVNIKSYPVDKSRAVVEGDESAAGMSYFRATVDSLCSNPKADTFLVVNFCRQKLGQTGSGHFSPIGGYHKELDLVLVLDVARFKYPPFWVPLKDLWAAMEVRFIIYLIQIIHIYIYYLLVVDCAIDIYH